MKKKPGKKIIRYARLPKYNKNGKLVVEEIEITDDVHKKVIGIDMAKDFLRHFYNKQAKDNMHNYDVVMPIIAQCFGKKSMPLIEMVFWVEVLEYSRFAIIMEQFISYARSECLVGDVTPDLSWIKFQ